MKNLLSAENVETNDFLSSCLVHLHAKLSPFCKSYSGLNITQYEASSILNLIWQGIKAALTLILNCFLRDL
jgi:hypothetical protein